MKKNFEKIEAFLRANGVKHFFDNSHYFTKDKVFFYFNRVENAEGKFLHVIVKLWETGEIVVYEEAYKNF